MLDTMRQVLPLLAAILATVWARPEPRAIDVEHPSLQPYQYQYDVNIPETGDQKSHSEERDETGLVVGNFQVVDPTGNLRKLFYRVEGNSGFVITDQQVMVGFAEPPPEPETFSTRQAADAGSQRGGERKHEAVAAGGDGEVNQNLFSNQPSSGSTDQFEDRFVTFQPGAGGVSGSNDFTLSNGKTIFLDGRSSLSVESGDSSGGDSFEEDSFKGNPEDPLHFEEGGSSEGDSASSETTSGLPQSGVANTDEQDSQRGSVQIVTSQAEDEKELKPFKFKGPAFTFSIQRTEPNRFDVKENIIGHSVEFSTHGGRIQRSAAGRH